MAPGRSDRAGCAKLAAMRIGVLGATGPAGGGLVARLADLGHEVVAGSRSVERAQAAKDELAGRWGDRVASVVPGTNADAAACELVILATKWDGILDSAREHADALAGKVVVSMANGLRKAGRGFSAIIPPEGSIAVQVQQAVPTAKVVASLQHVPAAELGELDHALDMDVLVCGDDEDAVALVSEVVGAIPGVRAVDAGPLVNSAGLEALTASLVHINVRHKTHSAIRVVGI
jgi:8-hydroxy-5-deazaflavin:NADPH oxidoreductase